MQSFITRDLRQCQGPTITAYTGKTRLRRSGAREDQEWTHHPGGKEGGALSGPASGVVGSAILYCECLPPIARLFDLNGGSDAIGEGAGELDTALDIRAVVGIMIAAAACGSPVSRCANKCFRRSAHDRKLETKERSILSGHAHPRAEWP